MRQFRSFKEWSSIVEDWRLSGLSVKEFCTQESISESRFYEIRKRLQRGTNKRRKISKPLFLPVQIKPEETIALPVAAKPASVLMEVTLSNGCYLRFPSTIDTQALIKITMALAEQC